MSKWWQVWKRQAPSAPAPVVKPPSKWRNLARAVTLALAGAEPAKSYKYPIRPPELFPGIVPSGAVAPALAMDSGAYSYAQTAYAGVAGFPGYPHLAMLATRAEYRAFASSLSTELTREWIVLNSSETAGDETKKKVTELTQKIKDIHLQSVIQRAAEHDSYFGRGHIFIDIKGHDNSLPLILDSRTVKLNSFDSVVTVEPMWTTPSAYNAIDPIAADFYKPTKYFVLGKEVHASRLMTVITRPLPDMLKPAFNFGGMSLSQLAEPYVDNWLRTKQSVSDIISNFSITALRTSMDQVLGGDDDGSDLLTRAKLFNAHRDNQGLMLLDKDREELVQLNVPLGSLDKLQAQAQEHLCSVSKQPAIVLTGISPTGLNASSEGEMRCWYDWVSAQQEAFWRLPIETVIKVLQLSMYGVIDPDITFTFQPLFQMTPKEQSEIRTANGTTDCNYIDRGVLSQEEVRDKLARDPESGYQGLEVEKLPEQEENDE